MRGGILNFIKFVEEFVEEKLLSSTCSPTDLINSLPSHIKIGQRAESRKKTFDRKDHSSESFFLKVFTFERMKSDL